MRKMDGDSEIHNGREKQRAKLSPGNAYGEGFGDSI